MELACIANYRGCAGRKPGNEDIPECAIEAEYQTEKQEGLDL
jgi:hypothetical protein